MVPLVVLHLQPVEVCKAYQILPIYPSV